MRYRMVSSLPGKPDLVFPGNKVAVFCDGDFWHGRDWTHRKAKLARGHNSGYWIAKIERNMGRDSEISEQLSQLGWTVLRFWEGDINADVDRVVSRIACALGR